MGLVFFFFTQEQQAIQVQQYERAAGEIHILAPLVKGDTLHMTVQCHWKILFIWVSQLRALHKSSYLHLKKGHITFTYQAALRKKLPKVWFEASGRRCGGTESYSKSHTRFPGAALQNFHTTTLAARSDWIEMPTPLCADTHTRNPKKWVISEQKNRKIVKVEKNHEVTQIQSPMSHCSLESCKDYLRNSTACSGSVAICIKPACAASTETWQKACMETQTPGYHCSSQLQLFTGKEKVSLPQELTSILLIATGPLITACETACSSQLIVRMQFS